jgi:hypothetical protein
LILSVAYAIVRINLLKINARAIWRSGMSRGAGGIRMNRFCRNRRKKVRKLKNAIFSLAFFGMSGYTSDVNNLLSALRTDILL